MIAAIVVAAVFPFFAGIACRFAEVPPGRGVTVAAGFLLAMCMWGRLWPPAALSGAWLAVMAARWVRSRQRRRRVPAMRPVPPRDQQRILREAAERLADDEELADLISRWEAAA